MATLQELSDGLAEATATAAASTVQVNARQGRPASGIVWAEGVVLTSSHVVESDDDITVTDDAGEHKATVAGRDGASDLAVLKVEGLQAKPAQRAATGDVRVGQIVLAVGRPGEIQASLGVVSSKAGRQRGWRGGGVDHLVVSDATLYEGFSGGPLADASGRVVGVNSWYYGRGTTRALGADAADRVAQSLLAHGKVPQPYLGIGTQPVYLAEELKALVGQDSGLMIVSVEADSPAARAGALQGDVLVALGDTATARMRDLYGALKSVDVGSTEALKVVRAGAVQDLSVTIGERAE